MIFHTLNVHQVRSIKDAKLTFHPHYNYLVGANGTGKTTLLECLSLLSNGHSFKTRETRPLIQQGQSQFVVYAQASETTISIAKSLDTPTRIKINGQLCHASSQLAYLSPCQVYYQDLFDIMNAGPSVRRSVLDWGLFHVKHDYLPVWKQYQKILKQRNSLLKRKPNEKDLQPWDEQLAQYGEAINQLRVEYLDKLKDSYDSILKQLSTVPISLNYYKGWDKKNSNTGLLQSLHKNQERDIIRGYTSVGIHQADILIDSGESQAKKTLSRGQQKIALIALKFAQCKLLDQHCIHLLDDVFSELDVNHQQKIATYIKQSQDQFFLSVLGNDENKIQDFPQGQNIYLPV